MTNRQSNIIFYGIIFSVISAMLINFYQPEFFTNFTKSKEEFLVKEAMKNGEYNKALANYKTLLERNLKANSDSGDSNTIETAIMYEDIANIYFLLGNTQKETDYYLKALDTKNQLKRVSVHSIANTYHKLGSLAQEKKKYQQAQAYFESSLQARLQDTQEVSEEDQSMFVGMQQTRLRHLRLNHAGTIATFKSLGAIHSHNKEYAIAKDYYERALASSKITFGEEDAKTLQIMDLIKQLAP
ncbi:MAG: tetratricopeptide repeat protein [Oceanospirillaceae bacterium]